MFAGLASYFDAADDGTDDGTVAVRPRRDAVVNVAMIALSLFFGLASNNGLVHGLDGYPLALRLADGILGTACLIGIWFYRRRWPVAFAVVAILIGIFSTLAGGIGVVAVFTAAIHRRWQTSLAVSLLAVVCIVPAVLLYPGSGKTHVVADIIVGVVATFAATGWGMFVRARRLLIATLRTQVRQAEEQADARAESARRGERERMAREMHDVLAHRLSLLSVHAGALEFRPDAPPEEVAQAAAVIRANAHEALDDLRSVINVLRDDDADATPERPQPTLADLPSLVAESRLAGLPVEYRCDLALDPGGDLSPTAGRTVYRIVQEALTNARKHTDLAPTIVDVRGRRGQGIEVSVSSEMNGTPAVMPGSGTGLVGLQERATLAGGELDCGPTADGRFVVHARLPWPESDPQLVRRASVQL
jgi:signal transduction histidine kinase